MFVGIPDMAYIGLDGLLMAGVNIVGVLGPKKDHNMYEDFRNFTYSRRLNFIEYDELNEPQLIQKIKRNKRHKEIMKDLKIPNIFSFGVCFW